MSVSSFETGEGLSPRIETPHPPSLREGTFSHKGRREGSVFECRYAFVAGFGQMRSKGGQSEACLRNHLCQTSS